LKFEIYLRFARLTKRAGNLKFGILIIVQHNIQNLNKNFVF